MSVFTFRYRDHLAQKHRGDLDNFSSEEQEQILARAQHWIEEWYKDPPINLFTGKVMKNPALGLSSFFWQAVDAVESENP